MPMTTRKNNGRIGLSFTLTFLIVYDAYSHHNSHTVLLLAKGRLMRSLCWSTKAMIR